MNTDSLATAAVRTHMRSIGAHDVIDGQCFADKTKYHYDCVSQCSQTGSKIMTSIRSCFVVTMGVDYTVWFLVIFGKPTIFQHQGRKFKDGGTRRRGE